jgi:hypothetical protein
MPNGSPVRRRILSSRSLLVVALMAAAHVAFAQAKNEPKRPRLAAGADTNDARAYYDHGLAKIERDPAEAADAFYWATRINPGVADAYYGQDSIRAVHGR